MVHDDDDDDDDDTAVGDGSIDDYDAVLFICVVLLLCVRWGHCSCCSAPLSAWCRSIGRSGRLVEGSRPIAGWGAR